MPVEINAGELDRRVLLLRPVYNATEDEIDSYEEVAEVSAAVAPKSGTETDDAARTVAITEVPIIMRYRADIDARWRVRDREQEYEVVARVDVERRHVRLELSCKEVL